MICGKEKCKCEEGDRSLVNAVLDKIGLRGMPILKRRRLVQ